MRILVLTNWYPPHHRGGYELSCQDVTERLRDRGHQVTVLCSDQRMAGVADDPDQVGVRRRLRMYFGEDEPVRPGIREQLAIERNNHDMLAEALASLEPDAVFVWHMAALSLGLLTALAEREVPLVYSICDDWLTYGPMMDPWTRRFHGGRLRRAAGAVARRLSGLPTRLPDLGTTGVFCFNSSTVRAGALASTPWTFPRSTVVFSGIDDRVYTNADARPDQWAWRLLYVGRFDPRKGIETLLEAMRLLPEATLTLCGLASPSERAWVDGLLVSNGLGDRVSVRTSERHQLPALYRAADAVVFPSEWPEPFGLVPVEAMACGTPVVATGSGGSGEYLQDGANSLLFPPGDERMLAAAVRRLAEDGDLRERLVAGGHRTAPLLTASALTDAMEACLEAAVGDRPDVPADRVVPDLTGTESPRAGRRES